MGNGTDAVVVGAGPNGLAAAITLAEAGLRVLVVEGADEIGGGTRTSELTLPGYLHDVCSAIHPSGITSPFLSRLPLAEHGLEWIQPEIALAHPLDGGHAALMHHDVDQTAAGLGGDGEVWRRSLGWVGEHWAQIAKYALGPKLRIPRHPLVMARFGVMAVRSATAFAKRFDTVAARALWAGLAAHSVAPLTQPLTAAVALGLGGAGHAGGWPIAGGGSQSITAAMAEYLGALGGRIQTGTRVASLDELPPAEVTLLSVAPSQFLAIAGDRVPRAYRKRLERYRRGPGVCKVDWALDGPIPWANRDVARAGTVHVGGTLEEIVSAEADVVAGRHPERPFLIVAQQSVFDRSRAPEGAHTGWAYCHVPAGSTVDMTAKIEAQIERFAPGFGDRVVARHTMTATDFASYSPNYVGGDISGGASTVRQLMFRPVVSPRPHATPLDGVFLCGASTDPGAGVHGMAGHHAARAALRHLRKARQKAISPS